MRGADSGRAWTGSRFAATALLLASLSILGKLAALVREIVVARAFGAGSELDAFLIAFTIPDILGTVALYVALNAFLPAYVRAGTQSAVAASALARVYAVRMTLVLGGVAVVLALMARPLVAMLAPELAPEAATQATRLLQLLAIIVVLRGWEGLTRAILNAWRRFALPTVASLMVGTVVAATVFLFAESSGIQALTWGTLSGAAIPLVMMAPSCWRGFRGRGGAGLEVGVVSSVVLLVAIEATALVFPLIDRALANRSLGDGSISALAYARTLYEAPFNILALALAVPLFPELARLHAKGDRDAFRALAVRGVRVMVGVLLPVAAMILVVRVPLVRAIYERGAFEAGDTLLTASALVGYAIGLPFLGMSAILLYAGYASDRHGRVLRFRVVALAFKLALSLLFVRFLGVAGLALATAGFSIVFCILAVRDMLGSVSEVIPAPRVVLPASAVAAGVAFGVAQVATRFEFDSGLGGLASQAVAWGAGLSVYALACRWGRVEEVLWAEQRLRDRWLTSRPES